MYTGCRYILKYCTLPSSQQIQTVQKRRNLTSVFSHLAEREDSTRLYSEVHSGSTRCYKPRLQHRELNGNTRKETIHHESGQLWEEAAQRCCEITFLRELEPKPSALVGPARSGRWDYTSSTGPSHTK